MADNTLLNVGTGGDTIATDDIGGIKYQRVKVTYGADGSSTDVSPTSPLPIISGNKVTYRAATAAVLVTATTVSVPFFLIQGSATKTIRVQSIIISGLTLTAVAYVNIGVAKYSTAATAGTATALTKVPVDSNSAAATANLVQVYTAAPTRGTLVGYISARRNLGQATTAAAAGIPEDIHFDFSDGKDGTTAILRGTAEGIGLEFLVAPASAVSMLLRVEWIEE